MGIYVALKKFSTCHICSHLAHLLLHASKLYYMRRNTLCDIHPHLHRFFMCAYTHTWCKTPTFWHCHMVKKWWMPIHLLDSEQFSHMHISHPYLIWTATFFASVAKHLFCYTCRDFTLFHMVDQFPKILKIDPCAQDSIAVFFGESTVQSTWWHDVILGVLTRYFFLYSQVLRFTPYLDGNRILAWMALRNCGWVRHGGCLCISATWCGSRIVPPSDTLTNYGGRWDQSNV